MRNINHQKPRYGIDQSGEYVPKKLSYLISSIALLVSLSCSACVKPNVCKCPTLDLKNKSPKELRAALNNNILSRITDILKNARVNFHTLKAIDYNDETKDKHRRAIKKKLLAYMAELKRLKVETKDPEIVKKVDDAYDEIRVTVNLWVPNLSVEKNAN